MPIVIQELISSDTISQAVDKINFNFDQLILNGGGPGGPLGPPGPTGPGGGRGLRGSSWYKDNTATPGVSPNTLIIPGLEEGDYYLQSNGQVWQYNGTTWIQTTINLTGPVGPSGLSFGFNYAGGFPGFSSINNQNVAYPVPMPGGVDSGANTATNQGVSTLLIGAVASNAIPPTGVAFTSAFRLPDLITKSLDSSVLSTLIHQKDSSSSAIRFMGGGDNLADKYEQSVLSDLANITLGVDDSFNINIPKAATAPVGISDLIGFNLNTTRRGQQFYAGKHINFFSGADLVLSGLDSEISDISFTVNTSNPGRPGKFLVSTTLGSAAALLEVGGNITIPDTTTKTGTILGDTGTISLIAATQIRLKHNTGGTILISSSAVTISSSTSPINILTTGSQNISIASVNFLGLAGTNLIQLTSSNIDIVGSTGVTVTSPVCTLTNDVILGSTPNSNSTTGSLLTRNTTTGRVEKIPDVAPVPLGGIIMWTGATVPIGWRLCIAGIGIVNGIAVPNLSDRFIVGAGGEYGISDTGGSADAVLVSHNHGGATLGGGEHNHLLVGPETDGQPNITLTATNTLKQGQAGQGTLGYALRGTVLSAVIGKSSTVGPHAHTITTDGVDGTNKNLPPYFALAFIIYVGVV